MIETLLSKRISGAPVVNDENELIGVISEGDCLKEVVKGKYGNLPILSGKVSEHMSTQVVSISSETNIFEAAKMFFGPQDTQVSGNKRRQANWTDKPEGYYESGVETQKRKLALAGYWILDIRALVDFGQLSGGGGF